MNNYLTNIFWELSLFCVLPASAFDVVFSNRTNSVLQKTDLSITYCRIFCYSLVVCFRFWRTLLKVQVKLMCMSNIPWLLLLFFILSALVFCVLFPGIFSAAFAHAALFRLDYTIDFFLFLVWLASLFDGSALEEH